MKPYRRYPPPPPGLLVMLGVVLLVTALVVSCSADARSADRVSALSRPALEREARTVARHGGIRSHRYGDASAYMKRLSAELVARAFGSQAGWASCVVSRESGWNPGAISRTDDHGLAQVNRPSHRWVDYGRITVDPVYAVAVFVRLSDRGSSRGPWAGGAYSC